MDDNYVNEENIYNNSVEHKPVVNKKAMLFITLCAVIPLILSYLISECFSNMANVGTIFIFNGIVDFVPAVVRCILIIILGYLLTKKHSDAIHFLGIYALGNALSEIVKSILGLILETIFPVTSNESEYATIQTLLSVVSVVTTVIFSCLLYNKIIGNNTIIPVSHADHSKIKIQMIKAYICIYILTIILSFVVTIPSMLYAKDKTLDFYNNMIFFVANALNTVTLALTFGVLYFFGYRLKKSRADSLKFAACYYLPHTFTVCISLFLTTVSNQLQYNMNSDTLANPQSAIIVSLISLVVSALSIVIDILLVFMAIKHFFPKQENSFSPDFTAVSQEASPDLETNETENEHT